MLICSKIVKNYKWITKVGSNIISIRHAVSFKTNYHDSISVIIQLYLTTSLGIQETACSTNFFKGRLYCVGTSHLICGAYQ